MKSIMTDDNSVVFVGFEISRSDLTGELIPVGLGGTPSCYLGAFHTLTLDEDGQYLTDSSSTYSVHVNEADEHKMLLHYDYVREPDNPYPAAHVQVDGRSEALDALNARRGHSKSLKDLHFPVGGKRFRPSLEDVVEFLIVEDFADARPGWEQAIEEHRQNWQRKQLMAAIRRDPEAAMIVLQDMSDSD